MLFNTLLCSNKNRKNSRYEFYCSSNSINDIACMSIAFCSFVICLFAGLWVMDRGCVLWMIQDGLAVVDCGLMADTLTMSIFFTKD